MSALHTLTVEVCIETVITSKCHGGGQIYCYEDRSGWSDMKFVGQKKVMFINMGVYGYVMSFMSLS